MLGVHAATIRTWEDRYGLVVPDRNAGGHRLYSRDQVEQLRFVRARLAQGLGASDAHRLLAERLDRGWQHGAGRAAAEPGQVSWLPEPGVAAGPDLAAERGQLAVLVVEHDQYAAETARHILSGEGLEVEVALGEVAARKALSRSRPAVAVVELLVSGGAGLDLCRSLTGDGVPVIAVSVLRWRDRALAAGAGVFLGKPLDLPRLAAAVRDLLGLSLRQDAVL